MIFRKENIKKYRKIVIIILVIFLIISCYFGYEYFNKLEIIQLINTTESQMMGYVLKTKNNDLIVVDGGTVGDSEELYNTISSNGGHVALWIFTHSHKDHTGAFVDLVNQNKDLKIDKIIVSLNNLDWVKQNDPTRYEDYQNFYNALEKEKSKVEEANLNENIKIDNIKMEILGIKNSELTVNAGNNQSVVFKVYVNNRSIIFLGDTGIESSNKLLLGENKNKLKSDIVQMAHHGQKGATEKLYDTIDPKICLWPTTIWLWNNDSGSGEDSGNYETKITRSWMEKLNIKKNYVAKDGIQKLYVW